MLLIKFKDGWIEGLDCYRFRLYGYLNMLLIEEIGKAPREVDLKNVSSVFADGNLIWERNKEVNG